MMQIQKLDKVQKQIIALESVIRVEKNKKDKKIHLQALKKLRYYLSESKKHPQERALSKKIFS